LNLNISVQFQTQAKGINKKKPSALSRSKDEIELQNADNSVKQVSAKILLVNYFSFYYNFVFQIAPTIPLSSKFISIPQLKKFQSRIQWL